MELQDVQSSSQIVTTNKPKTIVFTGRGASAALPVKALKGITKSNTLKLAIKHRLNGQF